MTLVSGLDYEQGRYSSVANRSLQSFGIHLQRREVRHEFDIQSRRVHRRDGGIGSGLVRGFLDRGWVVFENSLTIDPVSSADMLTIAGDIADPAIAERVINSAVEVFGRVDTLVNNAGIFISKPFTDYTEADFIPMMSVNVAGLFYVSQRAVRKMLTQSGHIVNITTLVGQPVKGVPSALAPSPRADLTRWRGRSRSNMPIMVSA